MGTLRERYEKAKEALDGRRSAELTLLRDVERIVRETEGDGVDVKWWRPGDRKGPSATLEDAIVWDLPDGARCAVDLEIRLSEFELPSHFLVPLRVFLDGREATARVGTEGWIGHTPHDVARNAINIIGEMIDDHVVRQPPKPL